MAIPIEGFCVIAKKSTLLPLLESGQVVPPNGTALADDDLWRCCFMAESDARKFLGTLESLDLNVSQGPDSDVVLVEEFDQSISPYCEWLSTGSWDKAVIGWKTGTRPETVSAKEGWDPAVGSGLHRRDPEGVRDLEFLRLDANVEVYRDRKTGEEVYLGRTSTPVDGLFSTASRMIRERVVSPGGGALTEEARDDVARAVEMLSKVLSEVPDWWNALWFHGKGQIALGDYTSAHRSLQRAFDLQKQVEAIPRELAGVCLELRRFDEAVEVAEAAASLMPDNSQTLGNLAISYLMAGRALESRATIEAALNLDPEDSINQRIQGFAEEVISGERDQPQSLSDLNRPPSKRKRPFWKFW